MPLDTSVSTTHLQRFKSNSRAHSSLSFVPFFSHQVFIEHLLCQALSCGTIVYKVNAPCPYISSSQTLSQPHLFHSENWIQTAFTPPEQCGGNSRAQFPWLRKQAAEGEVMDSIRPFICIRYVQPTLPAPRFSWWELPNATFSCFSWCPPWSSIFPSLLQKQPFVIMLGSLKAQFYN